MAFNRRTFVLIYAMVMVSLFPIVGAAEMYSLSGKVTDTAAHAVPSATVSARSVASGKTYTAKTNTDGAYSIPSLPAGDYEVWATAGELKAEPVRVTLAAGETTDLVVSPVPQP
jgi:hypothetical protein